MKIKNINIQQAIDSAKEALEKDKSISEASRSVFNILILIISMFIEKFSLDSTNSGKSPSSDPNRLKKKKFKQYDFRATTELNGKGLEQNKLYLQLANEKILYKYLDENNTIVQGTIIDTDLAEDAIFPKEDKLFEFNKIRKEILNVLVERGDIKPLRKPGGQRGAKRNTLSPIDMPDEIKELSVDKAKLPKGRKYITKGYSARQVIEINISRNVIEYRAEVVVDNLGNEYIAEFPEKLSRPVQYGTSVKSRTAFSSIYQLIPYKRIQEQFVNEYRIPLSVGSIYNFNKEASDKLLQLGFDSIIKTKLIASDVGHVDETSINIDPIFRTSNTKNH